MDEDKLSRVELGLLALVLGLSLFLRLTALDVFETSDEDQWQKCSLRFGIALQRHDWADTYQMGHPGAVTMWLGAVAARQAGLLQQPAADELVRQLMRSHVPNPGTGLPALTVGARRLIAILSWLGIVALFPLVHKLFGGRTALLATALVAFDPFFLAHSRIHHLDAVLTTFVTLSIACLLVYQFRERKSGYLIASAAAAGLAIANKSPGAMLAPWAGVALCLPPLLAGPTERRRGLLRGVAALALWGAVAVAVLAAVWPALWVNPLGTLRQTLALAKLYAASPHEHSNYFWSAVRPDPGPGFYPVAWAFRTTPWVLLGLAGLPAAWRRREWGALVGLPLLWVLLFGWAMTSGDKKFDRYILPVVPSLDVLAAVGWVALLRVWSVAAPARWARWAPAAVACVLAAGQFALAWPARPYYLSYYNPVLGGSAVAPRLLLVGWGEGLEQAAAYLNRKPAAANLVASTWHEHEFGDYFVGRTLHVEDTALAEPDYFVFYCNMLQRQLNSEITGPVVGRGQPEYVVRQNGIEYAWVYANTVYHQAEEQILARIVAQADPGQDLILLDVNAAFARTYAGQVPLEVFVPRRRDDAVQMGLQRLAAGRRHIWHLVYPDVAEGVSALVEKHLRQGATAGQEIEVDGVRAVRYDLPATPHFVPTAPSTPSDVRFGEHITLMGFDAESTLTPGRPLRVRLHWEANAPPAASYTIFIHLLGPEGVRYGQVDSRPQGGKLPTEVWQPGVRILDDYEVGVPADAPPGEYVLVVGMYDSALKRLPAYSPAGDELADDVLLLYGFTVPAGSAP